LLALVFCLLFGPVHAAESSLPEQLDKLVANALEQSGGAVRSIVLRLDAPGSGFHHASAAGALSAANDRAITVDDRFFIASISKTMTAVRALQLAEQGLFPLDARVSGLGVFEPAVIDALHRIDGRSFGGEVTIRQLLGHRSGMKDYLLDDRSGISRDFESGVAPGSMAAIWMSQWQDFSACRQSPDACPENVQATLYPARAWLPWDPAAFKSNPADRNAGLLNFYLAEMADAALFEPGTGSHYSDTNYMLLGVIIEHLTGSTLAEQLRLGIFEPLDMAGTRLDSPAETRQAASAGEVADFWIGDTPLPGSGMDISWDWGGGGVVSTAADLSTFLQALVAGRVFQDVGTLQQMVDFQPVRASEGVMQVGYGLGIRYASTRHGPRWGHGGAWGAKMEYFPALGLFVTGTVNAYGTGIDDALLERAVDLFAAHPD
jgi:D-alanyl-D-alanine carboxypeptidase